ALITAVVYGAVALIVKMDDVGLALTRREGDFKRKLGRAMVKGMPKLLATLTVVGTAAMLWVGGHIVLASAAELGWHAPYDLVHDLAHGVPEIGALTGVLEWAVNTLASAVLGMVLGSVLVLLVGWLPFGGGADAGDEPAAA